MSSEFWILAIAWAAGLAVIIQVLHLVRGMLKPRRGEDESHYCDLVMEKITTRPEFEQLSAAWLPIIEGSEIARPAVVRGGAIINAARLLADADQRQIGTLRETCREYINAVNGLASYVDEGLIRPKTFVRNYPDVHEAMMAELHLVVPFIWYESVFEVRGRWGYRPARLLAVFVALRALSPRPSVWEESQVSLGTACFMHLRRLGVLARAANWLRLTVSSPTINTRSKLAQEDYRKDLVENLRKVTLTRIPPPHANYEGAVRW